jgi:hypothetical protein
LLVANACGMGVGEWARLPTKQIGTRPSEYGKYYVLVVLSARLVAHKGELVYIHTYTYRH